MARGFMTNLERRRYYKRRQLFDKYKASLILAEKTTWTRIIIPDIWKSF